jgi:hypothetical protein
LRVRIPHLVAISVVAALWTGGCADNNPMQTCPVPGGRIEGIVRLGMTPVGGTVIATLVAGRPGDAARFEARVANDGSYAMDIPAGRYVLGVSLHGAHNPDYEYSAAGLRAGEAPPDTLVIDSTHSPIGVDFDLASLQVFLNLAPELDGQHAQVILHRLGMPPPQPDRAFLFEYTSQIENGGASIVAQGVVPGTYRLEIVTGSWVGDGYEGEHFWMPGVRDSSASPPVELHSNQVATVLGSVGTTPARIQGRISGAWEDLGIGAPSLSLFGLDSTIVRGERPVNQDGSFDEGIYVPASVKLLVTHAGIAQWVGGTTFDSAAVFDLQPGQTISGIEFVESGALIEVTPQNLDFASITLQFFDAATMTLEAAWNSQIAPSPSRLPVPNLRPGNYRLLVDLSLRGYSKWIPQWYDRAADPLDARVVTIHSEGDVVHVAVVMQDGATISGTISGEQSETDQFMIYVTQADDPSIWALRSLPSSSASFTILGIPNGSWKVGARRRADYDSGSSTPPPDTVWSRSASDWRWARIITIHDAEDVSGVEIVLPTGRK